MTSFLNPTDMTPLVVDGVACPPLMFDLRKPLGGDGVQRDQTGDAARHMRYAASLDLPRACLQVPHGGRAIICGGAPSISGRAEHIRRLKNDVPGAAVFALNWTHNWLVKNSIIPQACLFFEIDAEPDDILGAAHPEVVYFVCSHCHEKTFDQLLARVPRHNVVLWHSIPNSPGEAEVFKKHFAGDVQLGGGIATFLRTVSMAMLLGYRDFDLFGVDSSFPEGAESTHVEGYPAITRPQEDGFEVVMSDSASGEVRRFQTVGYLAHQVKEFQHYCQQNNHCFTMQVHGDGMLPWVHRCMYPVMYAQGDR